MIKKKTHQAHDILSEAYRMHRTSVNEWDYSDTESLYESIKEFCGTDSYDTSEDLSASVDSISGILAVRDALVLASDDEPLGMLDSIQMAFEIDPEHLPYYLLKQAPEAFTIFQTEEAVSLLSKAVKPYSEEDKGVFKNVIANAMESLDLLGEERALEIIESNY